MTKSPPNEFIKTYQICLKNAGKERDVFNPVECCNCEDKCRCRKKCGCNKCKNECYFPSLEEVKDDIERINNYIFLKGQKYDQFLDWDYPKVCLDKMVDLTIYLKTLKNLYTMLYNDSKGFKSKKQYCQEDYKNLKSEVNSIIGIVKIERFDHFKDNSGVNDFMVKNPNMVSFERWQKHLFQFETQYEIKVEKVLKKDECSRISYEVLKTEKGQCDIVVSALKKVEKCNASSQAKIQESKCKEQYSALIKTGQCDIKYSVFAKALKCGFTAKAIKSIYNCKGKIEVKGNSGKCYISFNGSPSVECNKENLKIIINKIECANIH